MTQNPPYEHNSFAIVQNVCVAKSDRSLDLKHTVSNYEFLGINQMLMKDDGTSSMSEQKVNSSMLLKV